jgi:hypothetical protein
VLLRTSVIILAFFIAACSGPTRKPQEQAIFQTLVEDVTFRKLADHCTNLSKRSEQQVWRAKKEWWERNGVVVEAADYGFSYNLIKLTGDRQETGARYAMGLNFDIVQAAEKQAKQVIENGLEESGCIELMTSYRDGERDLSENNERYGLLLKLMQDKKTRGQDLELEQAKIVNKTGVSFSRSSMNARRLAHRTICPGAEITTLKSNWPLEIFEAVCADDSYVLIECKWGNCTSR